jgi:hypothetical protein
MGAPNELIAVANRNEPTVPRLNPGVLSQLNYGTVHELRVQIADAVLLPYRQSQMGK